MKTAYCPVRIVEPYSNTYRFRVKADFAGKKLLKMMSVRFPFHKPSVWEDRISSGFVGINGKSVHPEQTVNLNDEVFHYNPKVIEPSVPDSVKILHVADDYVLVFKPAPMAMHPGGRYNKNALSEILKQQGFEDLRIVHRLDAVTSGVVLFARNKTFARNAMLCFSKSKVKKTYYARVSGNPAEDAMTIDAPIRRKTGFVFESKLGLTHAKEAITHFKVLQRGEDASIIKCEPKTGRTHQVRLHLQQWGFPIIDDPVYGVKGDNSSKKVQKTGISLLNAGLEIPELNVTWKLDMPNHWL